MADPVTVKGGYYDPTTHADETWVRSPDSEFKILTDLTDHLVASGKQAPAGRQTLYTEMAPCGSCASVLRQFQVRFPATSLLDILDLTLDGYAIRPGDDGSRDLFHWWLSEAVPAAYLDGVPEQFWSGFWPWPPQRAR